MEQQLQDSFCIQWQQHMGIHIQQHMDIQHIQQHKGIQHNQQHKDIQHKQSEHQHQQISFHSIQDDQDRHNQDQNSHKLHMGIQHIQQHKGGQPGHQPPVQLHACHSIPGS